MATKQDTPTSLKPEKESLARSLIAIVVAIVASNFSLQWLETQDWYVALPARVDELHQHLSWNLPLGFVCGYFVMVMWHLYVRSASAKANAKESTNWINPLLIVWNYFLHFLSAWMLVGLAREFGRIVNGRGLLALVCDGDTLYVPATNYSGMFMFIFTWSKLPELLDTVFLVIRGRNVMFLHWYHHITVLLYCWMVVREHYPGYMFALINAGVHTIMYYYYARMAQNVRPAFGQSLTMIQLLQMVIGVSFAVMFTVFSHTQADTCFGSTRIAQSGAHVLYLALAATGIMYGSYFCLFYVFYQQKYKAQKVK